MEVVKTVKCKLQVTPEDSQALRDTMLKYSQACNDALDVALDKGITNNITLHHKLYYTLKDQYGLTSNYVCRCFPRVTGAIKSAQRKRRKPKLFRPTSLDLDKDLFRLAQYLDTFTVSVATVAGRKKIPLAIGNYQLGLLKSQKPTSATINYSKAKKHFYINIVLSEERPAPNPTGRKGRIVGIDLGIVNLCSTSTGLKFSGKQVTHTRNLFRETRRSFQSKDTASSRRVLKRLSGREHRWMRDVNHTISKQIVASLQPGDTIVLENLTNIRDRRLFKEMRFRLNSWAFGQLQTFLEYKAKWAGIHVVYVSPAYTSRDCSLCSERGIRSGHRFSCRHCGHRAHSDFNSCFNLIRRAVSQFAPSDRPPSIGPKATQITAVASPLPL